MTTQFTRRAMVGATAVLALTLAACGGGEDADDAATGGGSNELTVWHYFSEDNQVALMDAYAEKFEAEHEGVTVNNVFQPYDQMNSKVVSAAGAGQGPDVIVFNGAEWSTLAMAGALAPLDDYWADFEGADQFPDAVLHGMDGSTYAVQGYVNLLGLWYNADILAEIGVEPPTTMEELESAMAAAVEAGHRGITLSALPQSQGEWQAYPWLSSAGFDYENLDEAALAEGFGRVRGWIEEGYLSQEAVTWDQTVPFQQFTAGGVAFAENGNWQMGAAAADADFEYGVVPLPLDEGGQVYLGGEGQAIGANAQNPDLAWEYLQSTYLDYDGQLIAQENVGSIPSRADASQEEGVTSDPLLQPFAQTLADMGTNYPAQVIPPEAVADVQAAVGQAWSAALAGQTAPEAAAAQVVGQLQGLIG
ncbi:sugar ABC transporter substrate-binding protein [Oceanitalea stevensii]|uniref:Extracellular solute-binding protein n=1 Tax=Oceanitalea stevensii TaxID=2763072 RepID=A0ABR8Z4J6_9MICO|nr:extracellular solute-binding protein [Oceanitalea stevensii]MBD8063246.1 extracellular solute-binding protein [Oceanitalea stevensii]HLU28894.1 extracellular solute-binding protein [Glycomyces sp.]